VFGLRFGIYFDIYFDIFECIYRDLFSYVLSTFAPWRDKVDKKYKLIFLR
jgi:hypothetical protein